jgi:hypothetical protein
LLTGLVDDNGSFRPELGIGSWTGSIALAEFRHHPTAIELIAVRYGPMAVFVALFVAGQYL